MFGIQLEKEYRNSGPRGAACAESVRRVCGERAEIVRRVCGECAASARRVCGECGEGDLRTSSSLALARAYCASTYAFST